MSIDSSLNSIAASRSIAPTDIKMLKFPEEGGTKKEFKDFLEKIKSHVSVNLEIGQDVGYTIKITELPVFTCWGELLTTQIMIQRITKNIDTKDMR